MWQQFLCSFPFFASHVCTAGGKIAEKLLFTDDHDHHPYSVRQKTPQEALGNRGLLMQTSERPHFQCLPKSPHLLFESLFLVFKKKTFRDYRKNWARFWWQQFSGDERFFELNYFHRLLLLFCLPKSLYHQASGRRRNLSICRESLGEVSLPNA